MSISSLTLMMGESIYSCPDALNRLSHGRTRRHLQPKVSTNRINPCGIQGQTTTVNSIQQGTGTSDFRRLEFAISLLPEEKKVPHAGLCSPLIKTSTFTYGAQHYADADFAHYIPSVGSYERL